MDVVGSYQATASVRYLVPSYVIRFLCYWLFGVPIIATHGMFVARCLRAKRQSKCGKFLKNLLVVALVLPLGLAFIAWQLYTEVTFMRRDETLGSVIFAVGCAAACLIIRKAYHFSNQRFSNI